MKFQVVRDFRQQISMDDVSAKDGLTAFGPLNTCEDAPTSGGRAMARYDLGNAARYSVAPMTRRTRFLNSCGPSAAARTRSG